MDFLNNLFSKDKPTDIDMQNYAVSLINISVTVSQEKYRSELRKKYPKLSSEETEKLINKSLEIFNYCCENIPAGDDKFNERAKELYPFLSKQALKALHGAVLFRTNVK